MRYDFFNLNEALETLRKWRENNERRSVDVLELWDAIIENNLHKLGNEKHVLFEQVIFAALDCHRYAVADNCIGRLATEFPGSMRVLRYRACRLEAAERYEEALEILDKIIKADETNAAARKRRIAILKAQGHITETIKELVDYLKKFMSNADAWQELCELYLSVQEYSRAVFCAEELLLHQPHSHLFHQRVADIRYTMGGLENLELAKLYYSQALKLNETNMRALLGLFLVTNNLLLHYKSSGTSNKRKEVLRLNQWAQQNITQRYRDVKNAGNDEPVNDRQSLDEALLALSFSDLTLEKSTNQ